MQSIYISTCALALAVGGAVSAMHSPGATASHAMGEETVTELGAIQWNHKLEPALSSAAKSKKPVMLLFQEIPG